MKNPFSPALSMRATLRKYTGGFTLVELIVVITILAILSAIWLLSFSGYSSGARDSTRVEDLANMQKSLAIYATTSINGKYPTPDNGVSILNNGALLRTQGYAGKTTLANIKFNGAGLDPLDNQYYTYSVNSTQTGFALMAYLENASNLTLTSYIEKSLAASTTDYSTRYPMVQGNPIGILIASGSLQPLQASGSGVDLAVSSTPYVAYIAPKVVITSSVGNTIYSAITTAWSGMTSTGSIPTLITGACTSLPANAFYYGSGSSYSVSNAPVGSLLTAVFSASTPSTNTCQFNCGSGYVWNGTACLVPAVSGPCTGLPANAVYYGSATSYTLAGAAVGTSLTASYTGGALIPNSCMFSCNSGYNWNGTTCSNTYSPWLPYLSTLTYTAGQTFTWSGATVTVSATGVGSSSTKSTGCDTNDIAIWQGGTNNVQIWVACNAGGSTIYTNQTYPSNTTPTAGQEAWMGGNYQWGNNADLTNAATSGTQVSTTGYGPWNYYNSSANFICGGTDWSLSQNDNLWGNTTNTSTARQGPCASGYHVPTGGTTDATTEWGIVYTILGGSYPNIMSTLKLPLSWYRSWNAGTLNGNQGSYAWYWSSSPGGNGSYVAAFPLSAGGINASSYRTYGFSIRCIRN